MNPAAAQPGTPGHPAVQTSALATASLILGLIGVLGLGPLTGIPAVICGAVALDRIGKARGGLGGHGQALAGLVTGALSFITGIALLMGLLLYPALGQARSKALQINDSANLKQLCIGLLMYAQDYDHQLPGDLGLLFPYVANGRVFVVPNFGTTPPNGPADVAAGRCDYLYFGSGLRLSEIRQPQQTPVVMTKPGLLAHGWVNVGYADGHVTRAASVPPEVQRLMDNRPAEAAAAAVGGPGVVAAKAPGSPDLQVAPSPPGTGSAAVGVPVLLEPQADAVLDNGRSDRKDDMLWDFEWSAVAGAERYQLFVMKSGANLPVINLNSLTESSYRHQQKGAYIAGRNQAGWTWKVRAGAGADWGAWSETRRFSVEPIDTDPPQE